MLCVPQTKPRAGLVIYDDAVFDAAQARVDLAVGLRALEGIHAIGEVGDPDPFTATIDAVREYKPEEIIISTYPETRSGWLRRDLIERVGDATGLPVKHMVADIDSEGLSVPRHAGGRQPHGLRRRAARGAQGQGRRNEPDRRERLFIVVVPQEGGDGNAYAARPHPPEAGARPPPRGRACTPPGWSAIPTPSRRS